MKKIINLLLVLCMLLSCAACSNQGENSTIIANVDFEIGDTGGLKVPFGNGELIEVSPWLLHAAQLKSIHKTNKRLIIFFILYPPLKNFYR